MHAPDLESLLIDGVLLVGALLSGLCIMAFLSLHPRYRFWLWPNVLLWCLLLLATSCLALALNNLLWDRITQGPHYGVAGSAISLLFPAAWLRFIRYFKRDAEPRSVLRAVVATAISLSVVITAWILGETIP